MQGSLAPHNLTTDTLAGNSMLVVAVPMVKCGYMSRGFFIRRRGNGQNSYVSVPGPKDRVCQSGSVIGLKPVART